MQDDYKGIERRKFKRVKVNFTAIYRIDKPIYVRMMAGNREVDGVLLDLSEGGLCILTALDIPASTILLIKFVLIDAHNFGEKRIAKMDIVGEVRYNILFGKYEHRLGIYFTQISDKDRKTIEDFVETRMATR
jgi:c-di-GMP-binding flagellar brake protein YcgR